MDHTNTTHTTDSSGTNSAVDGEKTSAPSSFEPVDDIVVESYNDDVPVEGEVAPEEHIKRLREKLKKCTSEKQEYLDGWQRTKADFVNYKKREAEEKGEFIKFAREELINDLVPVLESFQMAFANKEAWERIDPSWRKGVEYIHTQLFQILSEYGLSEINPLGEKFDPNIHTSVGTIETAESEKQHKIAEVLQLGYRLNGKVIRSPRVKIYLHNTDAPE